LFKVVEKSDIVLIPRYTDRPMRDDEEEGFEYYFTSHHGLLQKVYSNDFIHLEKWGDYYSGIDTRLLKIVINSKSDGLILASTFGASRLTASFGDIIQPLYIWTGQKESLQNPRSLESTSPEVKELKWRIAKKISESAFSEFEIASLSDDAFLEKRMVDNYLDIASVNGRLRSGEKITILPNLNSRIETTVLEFLKIREKVKNIVPAPLTNGLITNNGRDSEDKAKKLCKLLAIQKANFFLRLIIIICVGLWLCFIYLTEQYSWDIIEPKFSILTVPILGIAIIFFWFLITKRQLTLNPKELHNSIVDYYEKKYFKNCGIDE
jgi:guanylate kinase